MSGAAPDAKILLSERGDLVADALRAGQAALPFPDRERSLQRFTRLVDPACALEHRGQVLVRPRLPPDRVRPCLRSFDRRAHQRLRPLELASLGEQERLRGGGPPCDSTIAFIRSK